MPRPGEDRSDVGGAAQLDRTCPAFPLPDLSRFPASLSRFPRELLLGCWCQRASMSMPRKRWPDRPLRARTEPAGLPSSRSTALDFHRYIFPELLGARSDRVFS